MFDVGVLEANDERNCEVDFFDSGDDVFCKDVVFYDVVEDVDEDFFYVFIVSDEFESGCYVCCVCVVVYVEEVCWFGVVVFDDVYGCYG